MKKNKKEESNFFDDFKYNYENLEGFDSGVKILAFLLIAIVIIITARVSINNDRKERESTVPTTKIANKQTESLKVILDGLLDKEAYITIDAPTQNNLVIKLSNLKESDGLVTAFYESNHHGYQKLQIQNGAFYEIPAGETTPIENDDLLPKMNYKFLVPSELIKILETNKTVPTNTDDGVIYSYSYEDETSTSTIKVEIKKNVVESITITNDLHTYVITYK